MIVHITTLMFIFIFLFSSAVRNDLLSNNQMYTTSQVASSSAVDDHIPHNQIKQMQAQAIAGNLSSIQVEIITLHVMQFCWIN